MGENIRGFVLLFHLVVTVVALAAFYFGWKFWKKGALGKLFGTVGFVVGGLLFLNSILGFVNILSHNTKQEDYPLSPKRETSVPRETMVTKQWRQVTTFEGSDTKMTPSFYISGNEWRITYTISGGDIRLGPYFDCWIYRKGQNYGFEHFTKTNLGTDSTYIYEGGEFYLKIIADCIYEIVVEVPY